MSRFFLSNKEVTETDGSEAWAIMEVYKNDFGGISNRLFQIGFKDKEDAENTLIRVREAREPITYNKR